MITETDAHLYVNQGLSTYKIARECGYSSQSTAAYWLRKYGLRTARAKTRGIPQKHCENCRSPMTRKSRGNRFCSRACVADDKAKRYIERWLRYEETGLTEEGRIKGYIRRWLFSNRGEKCEKCGWAERNPVTGRVPVTIDHQDGRWQNTRPDNLRILCPNCHSLTPTFQALNKGYGHPRRREAYKSAAERRIERSGSAPVS